MDHTAGYAILTDYFYGRVEDFHAGGLFQFFHYFVQVVIGKGKFQCSGFYFRQVENISDQL